MTACYPIALLSQGLPCLVVGGGQVAERKVVGLLEARAQVRVVAPEATAHIRDLARGGRLQLVERQAEPRDLDECRLVIIATDDPQINEALAREAQRRNLLVNVVDAPALCNFFVPATVSRGEVQIAVTTGGASPALAKHLRGLLEGVVGEEYGALATLMGELREAVRARWPTQAERAAAWERLPESEVLELLRQRRWGEARRAARRALGLEGSTEE